MSRIRRGERVAPMETVRLAKGGRRIDMSVAISPICQADGKITGASKVARDITAQKLAENRVRVSEIRYRRMFEAAHDGVLLLDPATCKITDANPFMTKLLGYPREQLIGKELFEIGLLKDETASQEMFQKLTQKHEVRYEDLPLENRDGRHQEVEVVANLYQENGHAVIQCNIRDITARKLAEDALRHSEERYRSLFDSIDEGFCVIELLFDRKERPIDYRFLEVNPAFEKQTGIRGGLGKRMREIVDKIEPYWLKTYGQVVATGTPFRGSNEMKALDRWFDVYAFQLGGRQSRNVAVLFSDITERKKVEQVLRETRAQVATYAGKLEKLVTVRTAQLTATNRRLNASVDSNRRGKEEYRALFLASEEMQKKFRQLTRQVLTAQEDERRHISRELHDVVVQTLVGINVELAALGLVAGAAAPPLKAKIGQTQRLVEKSVHAVHQFARELRPPVLDDLGLVPALQAFMKTIAARQNMKLHLTAFAGVEALDSDRRTVLYRVAQEALTNVVRHAEASRVDVHIAEISGAVRMEVRDNGKSFDVARALSAKTNKRLGLLGMRERVEMLGGAVTIESVSGRGSTVRAELPFQKETGP